MVCATKPRRRTAVEDAMSWMPGVGLGTDGGDGRRRRLGPHCERGGDGRLAASRAVRRPRRERRLGPRHGGGNLPARGVLAVFSKPPSTWVSRTFQNCGPDLHQDGGIVERTSFARESSFEVLFTGFSGCHRSDRTARPVRPVSVCLDCHDRSDRSVAPVRPVQAIEFCDLHRVGSFASAQLPRAFR